MLLTTKQLYELIEQDEQCCLQLEVHDQQLFYRNKIIKDPNNFLADVPSVNLEKVIGPLHRMVKMRLSLLYTLLRSFWQYYGTQWTSNVWTKAQIHFMHTINSATLQHELFVQSPYLRTDFANPVSNGRVKAVHPRPTVLALGVMLLEIELGGAIESQVIKHNLQRYVRGDIQTTETRFTVAKILVEQKSLWGIDTDTNDVVRNIVRTCLDGSTLAGCKSIPQERMIIHNVMLVPLEQQVKWFCGAVESLRFPPINLRAQQQQTMSLTNSRDSAGPSNLPKSIKAISSK